MRKFSLVALLFSAVLFSCSNQKEAPLGDGYGSMTINAGTDTDIDFITTRAGTDVSEYTYILQDENIPANKFTGLISELEDGTITEVPVGTYTLTVTSHPGGFTPAFEDPWYFAEINGINIRKGSVTPVEIECTQANAGIYFVYDESLASIGGYSDIVPMIEQEGTGLVYTGADKQAAGYFNPGEVAITIMDGNTPLNIGGDEFQLLEVEARQLWEVTLKITPVETKTGINITAIVKVINDPTNEIVFELGEHDKVGMESSATELASKMYLAWNIGNTMETVNSTVSPFVTGTTLPSKIIAEEGSWNNPKVTKSMIDAVKAAGFNTVRIPCAWMGYVENDDVVTYKLKQSWLDRVREVVDYVVENDMYCILNIHWDGGWLDNNCTAAMMEPVNNAVYHIWKQIATQFKGYDEHLVFACANEPDVENAAQMAALKSYSQTFIDVVRATGGKNKYRNLIIQGPTTDIDKTYELMDMAGDSIEDRLMVEVHYYSPYQFTLMTRDEGWGVQAYFWGEPYHVDELLDGVDRNCNWGEEEYVHEQFAKMKEQFVDKGIPVILGEFGAQKRTLRNEAAAYQQHHIESVAYFLEYVTKEAKNYGIVPVYWDNGGSDFTLFNRNSETVSDQLLLDGLLRGAAAGQYPF